MASYEIDHIEIVNGEEIGVIYVDDEDVTPMLIEYTDGGVIIRDENDNDNDNDVVMEDDVVMENDEQYGAGGGDPYIMEKMRERHIAKFNVHGYEYHLRIPKLADNLEYDEAVQIFHRTLNGESMSSFILLYSIFKTFSSSFT